MTRSNTNLFGPAMLIAVSACMVIGCGGTGPSSADFNKTNISRVRSAYGIFVWLNNSKAPKSEEELKEFLKTDLTAQHRLKNIGVEVADVDAIFVSQRDDQPFTIRYGIDGRSGDKPIVFETEGIGGKRMVAFWEPVEVDQQRYASLLAGEEDQAYEAKDGE